MGLESAVITGVSAIAVDALSPGFFETRRPFPTGVSTAFSCLVGHILYYFLQSNEFKYNTGQAVCTGITATCICYLIPQVTLHDMPALFLFSSASTFLGGYLCEALGIEQKLEMINKDVPPPDAPLPPQPS